MCGILRHFACILRYYGGILSTVVVFASREPGDHDKYGNSWSPVRDWNLIAEGYEAAVLPTCTPRSLLCFVGCITYFVRSSGGNVVV